MRGLVLMLPLAYVGATGCDPVVDADYGGGRAECHHDIRYSDEEGVPAAESCTSEIREFGTLCSDCSDGSAECLAAWCQDDFIHSGCLRCFDPRGRRGTGCRPEWRLTVLEVVQAGSTSFGGVGAFDACTTVWTARWAQTRCNYPGPDGCVLSEVEGDRCLVCTLADGRDGGRLCLRDPADEMPDPLCGRPDDLPRPGTCVEMSSPDGRVTCTICTNADLSAQMVCNHPPAEDCVVMAGAGSSECIRCTHADGTNMTICDPPPRW